MARAERVKAALLRLKEMTGELAEQRENVRRTTQRREQLEDELRSRQLTLVSELQSIYPLEERRTSTPDGKTRV